MGLGRKDGNTGSFHKKGWIPAFAGMTGWGVRDAKPRSEWEGSEPHRVREECLNSHEFLKRRIRESLRLGLHPKTGNPQKSAIIAQFSAIEIHNSLISGDFCRLHHGCQKLDLGTKTPNPFRKTVRVSRNLPDAGKGGLHPGTPRLLGRPIGLVPCNSDFTTET